MIYILAKYAIIMTFKPIVILIILVVILVAGCVQQEEKTEKVIEKTSLLSFTEFFCYLTEQFKPFAYFQFAYQENGEIKYVKTKTTCDDLIKIGTSYDASKTPALFGEQLTVHFKGEKPVKIKRENGEVYDVKESEQIRRFFESQINVYDNLKYFRNSNSIKVVSECLLIGDNNQHDKCLSYQAAFQKDVSICDKMIDSLNQNLCKQWVENIIRGKINE